MSYNLFDANNAINKNIYCNNLNVSGTANIDGLLLTPDYTWVQNTVANNTNINSAGTFYQANVTYAFGATGNGFGLSGATGNSSIIYQGATGIYVINSNVQLQFGATGVSGDKVGAAMYRNGSALEGSNVLYTHLGDTGNTGAVVLSNELIATLNPSDALALYVTDVTNTCNLQVASANIVIKGVL